MTMVDNYDVTDNATITGTNYMDTSLSSLTESTMNFTKESTAEITEVLSTISLGYSSGTTSTDSSSSSLEVTENSDTWGSTTEDTKKESPYLIIMGSLFLLLFLTTIVALVIACVATKKASKLKRTHTVPQRDAECSSADGRPLPDAPSDKQLNKEAKPEQYKMDDIVQTEAFKNFEPSVVSILESEIIKSDKPFQIKRPSMHSTKIEA